MHLAGQRMDPSESRLRDRLPSDREGSMIVA